MEDQIILEVEKQGMKSKFEKSLFCGLSIIIGLSSFGNAVAAPATSRIVKVEMMDQSVIDMEMTLIDGFPVYRLMMPQKVKNWSSQNGRTLFFILKGRNKSENGWTLAGRLALERAQDDIEKKSVWGAWTYCPACFGLIDPRLKNLDELDEMERKINQARRSVSGQEEGLYSGGELSIIDMDPGIIEGPKAFSMAAAAARMVVAHEAETSQVREERATRERLIELSRRKSLSEELMLSCGSYYPSAERGDIAESIAWENDYFHHWESCLQNGVKSLDKRSRQEEYEILAAELKRMGRNPNFFVMPVTDEIKEVRTIWSRARDWHESRIEEMNKRAKEKGVMVLEEGGKENILVAPDSFQLKGKVSEGLQ